MTKAKDRKPMYENAMCKSVGMMATCNSCDRIIYEDEKYLEEYIKSNGYCKDCNEEMELESHKQNMPESDSTLDGLRILKNDMNVAKINFDNRKK